MENSKKKKNDTIDNLPYWRRYYPLIIAISTLLVLYFSFSQILPVMNGTYSAVLYSLIKLGYVISGFLACLIIPIILLVMVAVTKRGLWGNHNIITMWSDFFASAIIICSSILVWLCFIAFFVFGDTYTHKDTLELESHTYILSGRNTYDDLGYGNFVFFECDNLILFCSKIYDTNWGYDTSYPAELAYDEATQQLSIIVEGEVVETYQLDN